MSNTVVYGKASPIQVAGQQSNGYFLQNLGTAPVYVGYNTSVNSGTFDGVIQPGGTYNSGPNRAVWLYADADTPVVYNDDGGASANAGTNVTASIPGTLQTTVQNAVALAGGTAVGISGTPTVINGGGTVDTSGSAVTATPLQTYVNIASNLAVSLAPNASTRFAGPSLDVSRYQSLMVRFSSTTAANLDIGQFLIRWKDNTNGQLLVEERPLIWAAGMAYIVIPVKGPQLDLLLAADGHNGATMTGTLDVMLSTMLLPEYFYTNNSFTTFTGLPVAQHNLDPLTGDVLKFQANRTATGNESIGITGTYAFASYARKVNGVFIWNNSGIAGASCIFEIQAAAFGWSPASSVPYGNAGWVRLFTATLSGANASTQPFEIELPKAPCVLLFNGNTSLVAGQAVSISAEMAFQRF